MLSCLLWLWAPESHPARDTPDVVTLKPHHSGVYTTKRKTTQATKTVFPCGGKGRNISSSLPARGSPAAAAAALPSFCKAQTARGPQEIIWPYNLGMRVADVGEPSALQMAHTWFSLPCPSAVLWLSRHCIVSAN